MKNIPNKSLRLFSLFLCIMLLAAACMTGIATAETATATEAPALVPLTLTNAETGQAAQLEAYQIGEGQTVFLFAVRDLEGTETWFEVHTDEETVGAALLSAELIAGETGEYGLYVKAVLGVALDYNADGHYWAFYVNDEYAAAGVDQTPVEAGAIYAFRAE